jgi:hypothetical protein
MKIETAEILWELNILKPKDLVNAAVEWLVEGINSESLLLLAGLESEGMEKAPTLFELALRELGKPILSRKEALFSYARLMSVEILQGKIDPYKGAKKIWCASIGLDEPVHEIDPFIYAASEYEDRYEDRDFFAFEIIKEAHRWVPEANPWG